jgi:hypothetical protein
MQSREWLARCIVDYGFALHLVEPLKAVADQKGAYLRIMYYDASLMTSQTHCAVDAPLPRTG